MRTAEKGDHLVCPAQSGIWFDEQSDPPDAAYVDGFLYALRGVLDVPALDAAITHVADAHPALRARFRFEGGRVVQTIAPTSESVLEIVPKEAELEWRPVRLEQGPLFQAKLLSCGPSEWLLWLGFHHIVYDGHSAAMILREIEAAYARALSGGEPVAVTDDGYLSFSATSAGLAEAFEERARAVAERLADVEPLTFSRGDVDSEPSRAADTLRKDFRWMSGSHMSELASRYRVTPFMLSMAVWGIVLSRFSGASTFVISVASTHREPTWHDDTVGMLVNTVPVPLGVDATLPWSKYVASVRARIIEVLSDRDVPFSAVVSEATRRGVRGSLTEVMIGHEVPGHQLRLKGLSVEKVPHQIAVTPFGLDIVMDDTSERLCVDVVFAPSFVEPTIVAEMVDSFMFILAELATSGGDPMCAALGRREPTPPLPEEPGEHPIAALQRRRPDLHTRAAAFAVELDEEADGPIAILLPPGEELVVATAAAWMAKRVTVALSPHDLPERLLWIVEDQAVTTVIVDHVTAQLLPSCRRLLQVPEEAVECEAAGTVSPEPFRLLVVREGREDATLLLNGTSFTMLIRRQIDGRVLLPPEFVFTPSFAHTAAAAAFAMVLSGAATPVPSGSHVWQPLDDGGFVDQEGGWIALPETGGLALPEDLAVRSHGYLSEPGEVGELFVRGMAAPFTQGEAPGSCWVGTHLRARILSDGRFTLIRW